MGEAEEEEEEEEERGGISVKGREEGSDELMSEKHLVSANKSLSYYGVGGMGLGMAEKTFIEWKEEERNRREKEYGHGGDGGEDRGWGGDQRGRKHYDPKSYR